MTAINQKTLIYTIIGAAASILVAIVGAWAVLQSDIITMGREGAVAYVDRVNTLEDRVDSLYRTNTGLSAELTEMRLLLKHQPDRFEALYDYIDALDPPAWIKVYDRDANKFRMFYMNHAYEAVFGVSRELYIGRTDFEVYSNMVAEAYERNDMRVLVKRNFEEFVEPIRRRGHEEVTGEHTLFWKFYIRLPDGREAVAGILVGPQRRWNQLPSPPEEMKPEETNEAG